MDTETIHAVLSESQAGRLRFPEVVGRLVNAGVESYFVDFARGEKTIYTTNGESRTEAMVLPMKPIAQNFSSEGIVAAIRGAQADTIRYPEFVERSAAAGVIAYWAFLTGKKVVYFGRKGEVHTEEFPRAKS
jgi:uncharacterized protein YbcV (DUF1398 family)